jgi:hypothetical protein
LQGRRLSNRSDWVQVLMAEGGFSVWNARRRRRSCRRRISCFVTGARYE